MNTEYTWISGGVTAANGFKASGIHCGLRKNIDRLDLALIYSEKKCAAAGVFTKNKVFAAPVGISKQHLQSGYAQAIICNSGNANTCTEDGYDKATATCTALAAALSIPEDNVLVASTGVIGQPLPVEYILNGISELTNQLDQTVEASDRAARAIMTTDTKKKEFAMSYKHGNTTITLGGICKGSGMIEPNMATMLGFITTDINISPEILSSALKKIIPDTFNMISVDGDTSTNDSVIILASGMCGNTAITSTTDDGYSEFENALRKLCTEMLSLIHI